MVTRIFTGDVEHYVPDLGRMVAPGDEVEFDEAPDPSDGRWSTPATAKKRKAEKKVDVLDPEPSEPHARLDEPPVTEES